MSINRVSVNPTALWNRVSVQRTALKGVLAILLLSGFLLLLGDRLISQRELNGPSPEMTISGDTLVYTDMIDDNIQEAPIPFKYRVLVPLIARVLPFSPTLGLKVITYVSLFAAYVFALSACKRLGLSLSASFFGLFALYTSVWHLYNYHNPYLTDAFQLMALSLMFFSLAYRSVTGFSVGMVLGILSRETTLFLVPAWVATRRWRTLTLALAIGFAAYYAPRLVLTSGSGAFNYLSSIINGIQSLDTQEALLRPVFIQWGFTGILSLIGLLLAPINRFWPLLWVFLLLSLGAYVSSMVAGDIGRMFEIYFPIMIVSCAYLFSVLWRTAPYLTIVLVVSLAGRLFWVPTSLTPRDSLVFDSIYPRLFLMVLQLCVWLLILYVLRGRLKDEVSTKLRDLAGIVSRLVHRVQALAPGRA